MAVVVQKLYNGNVYIDGFSLFGAFEEVTLPEIKTVNQEHKALGMIGKLEFPSGFDMMTVKVKWNGPYDLGLITSSAVYTGQNLIFMASRESWDAAAGRYLEQPVRAYLNVRPKGIGGMNSKPMTDVDLETEWACTSYFLEIDGNPIVNIDINNSIYEVEGVDQLAQYRANLGI
jgi:P2 family phage contractile tail tube protein